MREQEAWSLKELGAPLGQSLGWELQDRLFISSKSPGLSDCLGEANVDRIGDLESFWIAAAFDSSPEDSNNRFVWKIRRGRRAFRWWNRHDDWSLGLESRSSTTQQIADCVLELAESNESA
ncbi:hypothetical protein MHU86_25793 [Fragilaria crotonensis]|nr:hypothetical protein MHU86_25793 [Fragilaria crotonensis]